MKIVLIISAYALFCLGLILGSYQHVQVLKDDGTVCAEIK